MVNHSRIELGRRLQCLSESEIAPFFLYYGFNCADLVLLRHASPVPASRVPRTRTSNATRYIW